MSADLIRLTLDDMLAGHIQLPSSVRVYWNIDTDGEQSYIRTERDVDHARGQRCVTAYVPLDRLLDSLAATKAGRRALLDALARHEA